MPYGYGHGFGFRGWSPPGPYVGRGRGGFPRCWYFGPPAPPPYWPAVSMGQVPYAPYAIPMTREQEMDMLKEQAAAMQEELDEIEVRMRDLEAKEG